MAAGAVEPNGVLVIIGHVGLPSCPHQPNSELHFPTIEEILGIVDLQAGLWKIERSETVNRDLTEPNGQRTRGTDNVVTLRRTLW
jgi:hypothetical protein